MLRIPADIEAASFAGAPIRFRRTVDALNKAVMRRDPKIAGWIRGCTNQAGLALSAALVEWIAWRLHGPWDVQILLQFAESLWASQIDPRYAKDLRPPRPNEDDLASHYIWSVWNSGNAQRRFLAQGKSKNASNLELASVARLVAPTKKPLDDWITNALKRLYDLYPVAKQHREKRAACNGPPVPREALDLSERFDPATTAEKLETLRASLDPIANPFLSTAEEMAEDH